MIRVYVKGRWAGFISPQLPYESHIAQIFYDGEDTLPNPQSMIGYSPESMFEMLVEYIDERHADDLESSK